MIDSSIYGFEVMEFEVIEVLWWRLSARFASANTSLGRRRTGTGSYRKNSSDSGRLGAFFLRTKNTQSTIMIQTSTTPPPIAPPMMAPKWDSVVGVLVTELVDKVELIVDEGLERIDGVGTLVANAP